MEDRWDELEDSMAHHGTGGQQDVRLSEMTACREALQVLANHGVVEDDSWAQIEEAIGNLG